MRNKLSPNLYGVVPKLYGFDTLIVFYSVLFYAVSVNQLNELKMNAQSKFLVVSDNFRVYY